MSQFYQGVTAGGLPPVVPTSFETDVNSPAIPLANQIDVFGGNTTNSNNLGIQTDGSSGGDTLTIQLTNRFSGTVTTVNATPTVLVTCPMVTNPATFLFIVKLVAYDLTNNVSGSTVATVTFRTTGGVPVNLVPDDFIIESDAAFIGSILFNGSSTLFTVQVTGKAASTIDWKAIGEYIFVN